MEDSVDASKPLPSEQFQEDAEEYAAAKQRAWDAVHALLAWRKARPFLFDGQHWYSRQLLQTILDSYFVCCRFERKEPDQKFIDLVRMLMSSKPPPRDSPQSQLQKAA